MATEHRVVVVDRWSGHMPIRVRRLIEAGLPIGVAARWQKVRREMSPAGLKKKAYEARN